MPVQSWAVLDRIHMKMERGKCSHPTSMPCILLPKGYLLDTQLNTLPRGTFPIVNTLKSVTTCNSESSWVFFLRGTSHYSRTNPSSSWDQWNQCPYRRVCHRPWWQLLSDSSGQVRLRQSLLRKASLVCLLRSVCLRSFLEDTATWCSRARGLRVQFPAVLLLALWF